MSQKKTLGESDTAQLERGRPCAPAWWCGALFGPVACCEFCGCCRFYKEPAGCWRCENCDEPGDVIVL